ncbi:MAG: polyphosphate kinase 1 [Flavisolibacter sp.]|nr:polyphosphate kinase 1 [Flavisolibacter sp.]MBD0376082.1 polyphosphate kinase 1 [Flavisolibacter sp.]
MAKYSFFNRDISWLSFNERVLKEASRPAVPLLERVKFLSIYSSNLDEFYRVRIPVLLALHKLYKKDTIGENQRKENPDIVIQVRDIINQQLAEYGKILTQQLVPSLKQNGIHLLYNEPIPKVICAATTEYFFSEVLAFLQPVYLSRLTSSFFPENNKLYLATIAETKEGKEEIIIVNIPSDVLPRFFTIQENNEQFIVFLDDIIKENLSAVFKNLIIKGSYSFKTTRDAEINLEDEYTGDIAEKIEKQIEKRDYGLATRFLYDPAMPLRNTESIIIECGLTNAIIVEGGVYHNLKDFSGLPVKNPKLSYAPLQSIVQNSSEEKELLLEQLIRKDIIIHPPYQSYNPVLRFFNEAAVNDDVEEIFVTLYRVAQESRIVNALISAAKNGKKVSVFIELKARFDEANNLKWSKKMKAAGIKIIYSIPNLKVHAKIALVTKRNKDIVSYVGLLATGNLNESTARFYTDHILLTSNQVLMQEMDVLFQFLSKRELPTKENLITFNHLLVAQFNLQQRFLELIDNEIRNAQSGLPARIIIKLNNLEERVLIKKLYEASNAGVKIDLIVRSICCLIPGIPGMSENITIKRIVDRYLEHGRVFIFHNNGKDEVFLGSADWMNRNIYRRIEVCFPVYNEEIKKEIIDLVNLQLRDNTQAVFIDKALNNIELHPDGQPVQSQQAIYHLLKDRVEG